MLAGVVYRLHAFEAFYSSSASFSVPVGDGENHSAVMFSVYATSGITENWGFRMSHSSASLIGPGEFLSLSIPCFGISETLPTRAYKSSVSQRLYFENIQITCEGSGVPTLKIGTIEWYVDGTLEKTYTNRSFTSALAFHPSVLGVFGTFPGFEHFVSNNLSFPIGCKVGSSTFSASGSITSNCGWRVKKNSWDSWTDFDCSFWHSNQAGDAEVSGTKTSDIDLFRRFEINNTTTQNEDEVWGSGVWSIIPNQPRQVAKLNPDYRALILRGGLQDVKGRNYSFTGQQLDCTSEEINPGTQSDTQTTVWSGSLDFLGIVESSSSSVEDKLGVTLYSPAYVSYSRNWGTSTAYGNENNFSRFGIDQANTSNLLPYHNWATPTWLWLHRMVPWVHPFWNLFMWFPPDTASSSVRWTLDGGVIDIDYYHKARQQQIEHPVFAGVNTGGRVSVITEPITQNGVTGLIQTISGMPCFWGIRSFGSSNVSNYYTTVQPTSSSISRWSGGVSFSGTNVVLPAGITSTEFRMGDFLTPPYMLPTIAQKIQIGFGSNVSALQVFGVDSKNQKVKIFDSSTDANPKLCNLVAGISTVYTTSAALDFGQGYITDTYTGIATGDYSSVYGNSLYATNGGTIRGFAYDKLLFNITPSNSLSTSAITSPIFHAPDWSKMQVYHTNGRTAIGISSTSPAIQFGTLEYFNYLTDQILLEPVVTDPTLAPTMGDFWMFENSFFIGVAGTTGLETRMENEFEKNNEWTILKHAWRDPDSALLTYSFWLPTNEGPVFCYANTYRLLPAWGFCPELKFNTNPRGLGTELGQYMYSFVTQRHNTVGAGSTSAELRLGSASSSIALTGVNSGWNVIYQNFKPQSSSADTRKYFDGERDIFSFRAYRGILVLSGVPARQITKLASTTTKDLQWGVVKQKTDSEFELIKFDNAQNQIGISTHTGTDAGVASIDYDYFLIFEDSGTLKIKNESGSKNMTISATSPSSPTLSAFADGTFLAYWIESNVIKMQQLDGNLNAINSVKTTNINDAEAVTQVQINANNSLVYVYLGYVDTGGDLQIKKSSDYVNFS